MIAVEEITYRARCAVLHRSPYTNTSPFIVMHACVHASSSSVTTHPGVLFFVHLALGGFTLRHRPW